MKYADMSADRGPIGFLCDEEYMLSNCNTYWRRGAWDEPLGRRVGLITGFGIAAGAGVVGSSGMMLSPCIVEQILQSVW